MARKYTRSFIPLRQEHPDYTVKGREATGKCIIETREGTGKMTFSVQYLMPETIYKVYLINAQQGKSMGLPVSSLHVDEKGKGELKWEFEPDDVGGTGRPIEDFNIAAVLFVRPDGIVAPLVGYKDEEVTWKRDFTEFSATVSAGEGPEVSNAAPEIAQESATLENRSWPVEEIQEEIPPQKEIVQDQPTPVSEGPIEPPQPQEDTDGGLDNIHLYGRMPDMPAEGPVQENKERVDEGVDPQNVNPVHENFKNMARKISEERRELEYYTATGPESPQSTEYQPANMDNIEYLFLTYPKMEPFNDQQKDVLWIRISVRELAYFPYRQWEMINEPFINSAHKKYNHLMMGLHKNGQDRELFLAVPDVYSNRTEGHARSLGFAEFKTCDGSRPTEGSHGYWLAGTQI